MNEELKEKFEAFLTNMQEEFNKQFNTQTPKNLFDCKNIQELFLFGKVDYKQFLDERKHLPIKKLATELIEKSIEIINEDWKPTMYNRWYYPCFIRKNDTVVFFDVPYDRYVTFVGSSLVFETEEKAKLASTILINEYNLMIKP